MDHFLTGEVSSESHCLCAYVCLQYYLLEDACSYESTSGVEGASATNVEVGLIKRLQNSQEVSTLQLDRERNTQTLKGNNVSMKKLYL